MARVSRWFLDIVLDAETLRWWSGHGSVSYGGQTYTGLGARWTAPKSLKRTASLKSEKLELDFDSARQTVNADPVGHLLDQKWRRRQVRLRRLAWDHGAGPDDGDVLSDDRGRIRNLSDELQAGKPAKLTMEIESGALAYLERRKELRTPAGQKRVFPDDLGFDLIARLEGTTLPWRTKHTKSGTVQVKFQDKYEPAPRQMALGRFATAGSFVAEFTNGQQRKYWQRVRAIADHRISQLDKVWINGELVRDAPLTHGARTLVRITGDKGEDRCWVTFYDGRPDQVADAYLVAAEPLWTADHRLQGVAYVIFEHLWDEDIAESFDYRVGGKGALLYDRRQDGTAGGTGAQRWDDPATWAYSANAMVAADHYRSGIRIDAGSDAIWFGVGEAPDAVPYGEFAAIADHCDEDVDLKAGGTQKRYEVNGVIASDSSHDKILQKFADQMAARPIDQGGRIAFRPPIVRTPVVTLTDEDLVRNSKSKIDPGAGVDDMINTIDGQFINPENDYKKDDFPKVQNAAYVEDDNGEISDSLDLDLENSGERGQRIGWLRIEDSRRILQQEETYKSKAKDIEPGEWFVRESVLRGFPDGKMFIADEVDRFVDGSIEVKASEVFPDELVWVKETATDQPTSPIVPVTGLSDLPVPAITVEPVAVSTGEDIRPAIRLTHAAYADFVGDEIIAELGFSNGLEGEALGIAGQSQFAKLPGNQETVDAFVGLPRSTAFAIRFRARAGERHSDWSAFQAFISTSIYQVGSAAEVGGRSAAEIVGGIDSNAGGLAREMLLRATWSAANEALLWIGGETVGAVAQQAREAGATNAASLALLGARSLDDTAFVLDADSVTVPAGEDDGSSAISLRALRTQHNRNTSDLVFLLESVDGALSQATLSLDVNGYVIGFKVINEGAPANSGFYILADSFAVADPGNDLDEPFFPFAVVEGIVYMDDVVVGTVKANSIVTDNLVDNSVNEGVLSTDGSTRAISAALGYTEIDSVVFDKYRAGSDMEITLHAQVGKTSGGGDFNAELRIQRNGVTVTGGTINHYYESQFIHSMIVVLTVSGVPAGASTWDFDIKVASGKGTSAVADVNCYFSQVKVKEEKK